ncbi:unnamed protein product, partial [Amoebophrya sp. A25]
KRDRQHAVQSQARKNVADSRRGFNLQSPEERDKSQEDDSMVSAAEEFDLPADAASSSSSSWRSSEESSASDADSKSAVAHRVPRQVSGGSPVANQKRPLREVIKHKNEKSAPVRKVRSGAAPAGAATVHAERLGPDSREPAAVIENGEAPPQMPDTSTVSAVIAELATASFDGAAMGVDSSTGLTLPPVVSSVDDFSASAPSDPVLASTSSIVDDTGIVVAPHAAHARAGVSSTEENGEHPNQHSGDGAAASTTSMASNFSMLNDARILDPDSPEDLSVMSSIARISPMEPLNSNPESMLCMDLLLNDQLRQQREAEDSASLASSSTFSLSMAASGSAASTDRVATSSSGADFCISSDQMLDNMSAASAFGDRDPTTAPSRSSRILHQGEDGEDQHLQNLLQDEDGERTPLPRPGGHSSNTDDAPTTLEDQDRESPLGGGGQGSTLTDAGTGTGLLNHRVQVDVSPQVQEAHASRRSSLASRFSDDLPDVDVGLPALVAPRLQDSPGSPAQDDEERTDEARINPPILEVMVETAVHAVISGPSSAGDPLRDANTRTISRILAPVAGPPGTAGRTRTVVPTSTRSSPGAEPPETRARSPSTT